MGAGRLEARLTARLSTLAGGVIVLVGGVLGHRHEPDARR